MEVERLSISFPKKVVLEGVYFEDHAVVLFGGSASDSTTWVLMDDNWQPFFPTGGPWPERREAAAMAYDPQVGRLVMTGGDGDAGRLADAWTYSMESGWEPIEELVEPRAGHVMAFDTAAQAMVLWGGSDPGAESAVEFRRVEQGEWQARPIDTPPRRAAVGAFDIERQHFVVFGGASNADGLFGSTIRLPSAPDDELVDLVPAPTSPGAALRAAMAYDSWRGEIVMFGGDNIGTLDQTWLWDGSSWRQADPESVPEGRTEAAMTFDGSRGVVVMFGGKKVNGQALGDTWEWDGLEWHNIVESDARWGAAMAYDPLSHQVVRYGGNNNGVVQQDTWIYDGANWSLVADGGPSSYGGPMVSTPTGVLLFQAGQTVSFDGATWVGEDDGGAAPAGTVAMSYDLATGRAVVFGDADTWELLDRRWTFPSPRNAPDVRRSHAMAYDPRSRRTFMSGGSQNGGIYFDETWSYRWEGERDEACYSGRDVDGDSIVGCDDPDCWAVCTPAMPPGTLGGFVGPQCGNAECDDLETARMCPQDCGEPLTVCGDGLCDGPETCPGDCP